MEAKSNNYESLFNRLGCFAYESTKEEQLWVPTFLGDNVKDFIGISASRFLKSKKNWLDFIIPIDRNRVMSESKLLDLGPNSITQEYRIHNAKGEVIWVRDVKHSFLQNKKLIIAGLVFNITNIKELEDLNTHLLHEVSEKNIGLEHAISALTILNKNLENDIKSTKAILHMQLKKEIFPLLDFLPKGKYAVVIDEIKNKLSLPFFKIPLMKQNNLTKQENSVLSYVQSGLTQQEIASELQISLDTVKSHVKNIKAKLGLKGKGHLFGLLNNLSKQ